MSYKLYTDKSSVRKQYSRMLQGGDADVGEKFIRWWERKVFPKDSTTDKKFTITETYAGKPDLISFDYYGRNDLAWLVLQYNNIIDIQVELAVGKEILLPSKDRIFFEFLTKPVASKRLIS